MSKEVGIFSCQQQHCLDKLQTLQEKLERRLYEYEFLMAQERSILKSCNRTLFAQKGINNFQYKQALRNQFLTRKQTRNNFNRSPLSTSSNSSSTNSSSSSTSSSSSASMLVVLQPALAQEQSSSSQSSLSLSPQQSSKPSIQQSHISQQFNNNQQSIVHRCIHDDGVHIEPSPKRAQSLSSPLYSPLSQSLSPKTENNLLLNRPFITNDTHHQYYYHKDHNPKIIYSQQIDSNDADKIMIKSINKMPNQLKTTAVTSHIIEHSCSIMETTLDLDEEDDIEDEDDIFFDCDTIDTRL